MQLNEFQERCYLTAKYPSGTNDGRAYVVMGLCGEAGEVANNVKKIIRDCNEDGDAFYTVAQMERAAKLKADLLTKTKEELGDTLWYVATVAREFGWTLEDVAQENFKKLVDRHGVKYE